MTAAERGFLLLCAELGDGRRPLTPAQLRTLRARVLAEGSAPADPDRPLRREDLRALGYDEAFASRVADLLGRERELKTYLDLASRHGIRPLTRVSADYPERLRRLGDKAPAVLFCRGDAGLLNRPAVSVVGSRSLTQAGASFARRSGELAAREGLLLVSGNARGADRTAQDACLEAGGAVAAIVPDALVPHGPDREGMVFLCLQGWHLPMEPYRALERNRLIHAMGDKTLVAQTGLSGGTWSGTTENLRRGWSPVFVHADGSPGSLALQELGAVPVRLEELTSLKSLRPAALRLDLTETTEASCLL